MNKSKKHCNKENKENNPNDWCKCLLKILNKGKRRKLGQIESRGWDIFKTCEPIRIFIHTANILDFRFKS